MQWWIWIGVGWRIWMGAGMADMYGDERYCYLAAMRPILGPWGGDILNYLMLMTALYQVRPEGHWEPHNKFWPPLPTPPPVVFRRVYLLKTRRWNPGFFVTFNNILKHIFPENFIEFPQVVQKIWRNSLSILAIFINFLSFLDFLTLPYYKETNYVSL